MTASNSNIDRVSMTERPDERPIGFQKWSTLAFAHWRIPVEVLRPLIPERLTIDTFDGSAWIAVVPFHMSNVRPAWYPFRYGYWPFHETNLRTYVHLEGRDPGVWFFSLDAESRLAVWLARIGWNLNYVFSAMSIKQDGDRIEYRSRRSGSRAGDSGEVDLEIVAGEGVALDGAMPGTLEHFLAERYLLYSVDRRGRLYQGRVWHRPYPLRSAKLLRCRQSLSDASGIPLADNPDNLLFSEGVTVDIFPLNRLKV